MSEKKFDAQNNYGWGLTLDMTGKAPAINKRIFETLVDAQEYADNYNDSAIEGLILSVVNDETESNNGSYFIKRIKTDENDESAILYKLTTKEDINKYTVNEKQITSNPILDTDDVKISSNYSVLNKIPENVTPGDDITLAISKLEITLAQTTLALTAAINDLEAKVKDLNEYLESTILDYQTINNELENIING